MATANSFDLLGDDDNDDPSQLIASQQQKIVAKKPAAVAPSAPAKLPSKPAPPSQAGSTLIDDAGVIREEKEFDEVWRELHALKKLYGLVYPKKGNNSPQTQQAQDCLDEKSKLLLKKLLDEATHKAIQSQSKLLQLKITSSAPEPLLLGGKSTELLKPEVGNRKEIQNLEEHQPFTFRAKGSGLALHPDRQIRHHHGPDLNHQDCPMVRSNSSKSAATTKNCVLSDHGKTSSCNVPNVLTQKLQGQMPTRRVIQENRLTSGSSLLSEPEHVPPKRSRRLQTPAQTPSELTRKESPTHATDLVPLRPKKDRERNPNVAEGNNTLPCRMQSLKDGRMKQTALPDQTADNILLKNHPDKSGTKIHLMRKQRSDLKRMDSLKTEKALVKRDQVDSVKQGQMKSRTANSNLEERRQQLNQIGGRIPKPPYPQGSKQQADQVSESSSVKPSQMVKYIPVSKTERRSGWSPTSSRRKTSPELPRQAAERQKRTGWDSPHRKGRVRRQCLPSSSGIQVSHSGTSRSEATSSSEIRAGRRSKRDNRRMVDWKMTDRHLHQVVPQEKKKRMPRQMRSLHFHHHHHHDHVEGEDKHISTWQHLRGMFHHTRKGDEKYGERAAKRAPRHSQHGYLHTLLEGLLRHVWHTRQRKAAKAAKRRRLRKATSLVRGKKKKPHWWHLFFRRGGVKLASRNKPRLRIGFGETNKRG